MYSHVSSGMSRISVAIVNHNTREHLRGCLATVEAEAPAEIVVVDNASTDGSVELVRSNHSSVVIHANRTGRGYGAGANQAIAACTSDYVLLLSADTLLEPGALRALSAYFDWNPDVAIAGPRLVNPDGTAQRSCHPFPTPLHTLLENSPLGDLVERVPLARSRYVRTWSHSDRPRAVPWIKGAALAVRRKAFEEVGGFDESFFLYFEDVDLCFRLRSAGWQIHFAPVTRVVHAGGASTRLQPTESAVQLFASTFEFYRHHRSDRDLARAIAIVRAIMVARRLRDTARLQVTRDAAKRDTLAQDLDAWRRVLVECREVRRDGGGPGAGLRPTGSG